MRAAGLVATIRRDDRVEAPMNAIRNLAGLLFGGVTALLMDPASAQHAEKRADSPDVGGLPVLSLRTRIPLPGVYGRIDDFGWDGKRADLIVSALGNDTVEIVNSWRRVHTIAGLEHPQASVYLPGVDRIAGSSQSRKLRFYDAEAHALVTTLDFGANTHTHHTRYTS